MSVNVGEGFHARDGWYFQRQDDGSVKISAAVSRSTETLTIPPNEWASIVAAVSAQGETAETYQAALSAHGRVAEKASDVAGIAEAMRQAKENPGRVVEVAE